MKQKLILWVAAALITFLAGYLNSVTDEHYPVTGTIGINAMKVSYRFDKIFNNIDQYKVLIRSDIPDLNGKVLWREKGSGDWNEVELVNSGNLIFTELPEFEYDSFIEYRAEIYYEGRTYLLPGKKPVTMKITGKISSTVMILYYLTLFGGILLSTRTGLEFFNERARVRLFSIITLIFFFLYTLAVSPAKYSYELNVFNNRIPSITELFDLQSILFLLLWISGMWGAFKFKNSKLFLLLISVFTLLTFLLGA